MYFKRIEMHGFKSFAEPVSLEFHKGITCVVGPNGSGKSNISDAIRWVLGEQSPKTLRGGKMEEVIFAGTASRKPRGIAEVTIVINNHTGILPIDFAEVAITRKMYRSGESEYSINNSPCRLKDIKELIMDTGMGVDGYSIIGQGKISEIVNNKAEGRREIFEEAAGIVKYRAKKGEAEKKLSGAHYNLERVNDIISEIESRIDKLREDSIKAKEYVELRERFKLTEVNITLKTVENIELKTEYLKDELLGMSNEIDEMKETREGIDKDIENNNNELTELEEDMNKVRLSLSDKINQLNVIKNSIEVSKERIIGIDKNKERLGTELEETSLRVDADSKVLLELEAKKDEAELRWQELSALFDTKEAEYKLLLAEISDRMTSIENRKNSMFELYNKVTAGKTEIAGLESLKDGLNKRKEQITQDRQSAVEIVAELDKKLDELIKNLNEINALSIQLTDNRDRLVNKVNEGTIAERELRFKLEETKKDKHQAETKKNLMEGMENSYEGYSYAVRYIMKNRELIKGIHGVVADLIEVPKGYEMAIETALGQAMQNIVCDDDHSARNAVDKLKIDKAGRATFLPVDSIKGNRNANSGTEGKSLKGAEGFRGFAAELVKFDSKYDNIINYLLGRVVITDDLKSAIKLSKNGTGGLRFVTLEGDVVNQSGAITGGTFKANTTNLLERKAEIKSLGLKIEELSKAENRIIKESDILREKNITLKQELNVIENNLKEASADIVAFENQIDKLKGERVIIKGNENRWATELKNIDEEKTKTDEIIEKILKDVEIKTGSINQNEENVNFEVLQYEQKREFSIKLGDEITRLKLELSGCDNEKSRIAESFDRINIQKEILKNERNRKESEISNLIKQRKELQDSIDKDEKIASNYDIERINFEDYILTSEEKKKLTKSYIEEILRKKDQMEVLITNIQTQKHELDIKIAKNETQIDSLKNKLWDDFEISYIQAIALGKKDFVMNSALKESRDIKNRMKDLGEVNIGAIKEYETVSERHSFLTEQREDLLNAIDSLRLIINDMDKTIKLRFKESFELISEAFQEVFTELFAGGTAELKLEDEENLLESNIEIIAQPPGKKLQNINLLSGGEKSLTAIALMCAILKVKPTPFCILDEVEAALDDINISRFVEYLKKIETVQFVLVTHQKATMEHADIMYGITMPEQGISKVISLDMGEISTINN